MDRQVRIRNRITGQIEAILNFAKKIEANATVSAIRPRLDDLIKHHADFNDIEIELQEFSEYKPITQKVDDDYYTARTLLEDALAERTATNKTTSKTGEELNDTLESFVAQQKTFYETLNATSTVKLPKINVEPFGGDYGVWPSFRDLYVNAIHNHPNLKGSQKLQQLKGLLRGEAAGLIRHITTTDQNYEEAWKKLEARYNKPKPIVSALIQSFLDQKPCKGMSYKDLRRLYDHSDEVVRALRSLGEKEESRDPWLIHLLLQKVDNDTKQLWARDSVNNPHPTFDEFLDFLNIRCDALESCNIQEKRTYPTQITKSFLIESSGQPDPRFICYLCNGEHLLFRCPSFRSSTLEARLKLVNEQRLCHNCLRRGHFATKCLSKNSCLICHKRHHSLLHVHPTTTLHQETNAYPAFVEQPRLNHKTTDDQPTTLMQDQSLDQPISLAISSNSQQVEKTDQPLVLSKVETTTNFCLPQSSNCVILPTAVVNVKSHSGEIVEARALLDSGSQCAFVTESLVKRLGLYRSKANMKIIGLAAAHVGSTRGKTTLNIQSRFNPHYSISIPSQIIKTISSKLPETNVEIQSYEKLTNIELADPTFTESRPIDLLIGVEYFFDIVENQKMIIPGLPTLYKSRFGWLVAGNLESKHSTDKCNMSLMVKSIDVEQEDLNELLKIFWVVEEIPSIPKFNQRDEYCEDLYNMTTTKTNNNRFELKLPFLSPRLALGNSYNNAKCRLLAMERKFKGNTEFQKEYSDFMKEYIQLNHMKKVDWSQIPDDDNKRYFLPHHGVYKENSTTTKLRVVFDASCKTSTAVSLNDVLHVGPKIQKDLFTILLSFRLHQIVFVADIEKMYRQIMLNEEDCNYQLILWQDDPLMKINIYKLLTITYGVNCSPFLAVRTLKQIARDNETKYPNASNAILNNFYIDDLLTGADSEEAALKLKNEIVALLEQHGFHLRKWRSNSNLVLESFSIDETTASCKFFEENQSATTLGIIWNSTTDTFSFRTQLSETNEWTKRRILSEISKIYDPFGWLAPSVMIFKMMIQKLWVAHLDWDTPVSEEVKNEFQSIYQGLTHLNKVEIQRPYHKVVKAKLKNLEIHAFCDASEKAYGAVVYLRAVGTDGSISTEIICSKGKVAPIKQICLPRLELCGAYILSKLVKLIKSSLFNDVPITVHAWCDSFVVLYWLADIPRRWKTFVANRTSFILDVIPTQQWHYIPSKQNPADLLSRGVHPERLHQARLWWKGPSWLEQPIINWPRQKISLKGLNDNVLETKDTTLFCANVLSQVSIIDKLIISCSSYLKVKCSLVYVLRFCRISTGSKLKVHGPIQIKELTQAENVIFRSIQSQHFSNEVASIRKNEGIKTKSKLRSLNVFLDAYGVLRVGGRLKNSKLKYSAQHPVILPRGHPLNNLIVKEIHYSLLHGGISLVCNMLRLKFWMIDARNTIKSFINKCTTCIRYRAVSRCPRMGDLPAERVTQYRPFLNCGVDYAGPVHIKTSKLRKAPMIKAYISVFVCLAVKAVHLEVVTSLDTESFIAALRRFIARRGLPAAIWCDNGTNLVSGNSEIKLLNKQLIQQQNSNDVLNFCLQNNIEFHFSPPSGPHFGGLWEASVKSAKYHLRRVTNNCNFTFEELSTMMTQIEAVLNSRPLCRLHDDIDALQALTPGHFLIGEPMRSLPEPNLQSIPENKLNLWQNIQKRVQGFWNSWHKDYLSTLNQHFKWQKDGPVYHIDDIVLIRENNLPPTKWLLGRVITVYPGKDGIVRVVKLRTAHNELIRPVVKLVKLPGVNDESTIN